jgi:hypothetical protein
MPSDRAAANPPFDAQEFDETKYTERFAQLQSAYKRAFSEVNETYDSELVHAIDQQVLNESEPFYDPEKGFYVEVPDEPVARVAAAGVIADQERVQTVIDAYTDAIARALATEFTEN